MDVQCSVCGTGLVVIPGDIGQRYHCPQCALSEPSRKVIHHGFATGSDGEVTRKIDADEAEVGFESVMEAGEPLFVVFRRDNQIGIWCGAPPSQEMLEILTNVVMGYGAELQAILNAEEAQLQAIDDKKREEEKH